MLGVYKQLCANKSDRKPLKDVNDVFKTCFSCQKIKYCKFEGTFIFSFIFLPFSDLFFFFFFVHVKRLESYRHRKHGF